LQLDALQKKQAAATEASVAATERSGVRWTPLNPSTERTVSIIISRAAAETNRLVSQRVEKMRESVQIAQTAKEALDAGDVVKADAAIREASAAWSNNEILKRLVPKFDELQKATIAAKLEAEKAAYTASLQAANAAPTPKPAPTPTPAPTAAVEEETTTAEPSLFAKPAFWVIIVLLIGLAALANKFLSRKATQQEDGDIEQ
jgi:hypothetical protein